MDKESCNRLQAEHILRGKAIDEQCLRLEKINRVMIIVTLWSDKAGKNMCVSGYM